MQADVETVHNLIEMEFYEIEWFTSRQNFMDKAYSYQLYFNLQRPNSYKENKTPWQLVKEKQADLNIQSLFRSLKLYLSLRSKKYTIFFLK